MTAWAETWAPIPREKLPSNALAGHESNWDLVVATAFSFFFLSLKVSARLQQLMAWLLSSDSLEKRKALCPALDPAGRWAPASQLSLQHLFVLSPLFWGADDWQLPFTAAVSQGQTEQQKRLQLRKDRLLKLGSVNQSVSVCLSTKHAADCD